MVREAARRVLGMRHFDCQLVGDGLAWLCIAAVLPDAAALQECCLETCTCCESPTCSLRAAAGMQHTSGGVPRLQHMQLQQQQRLL